MTDSTTLKASMVSALNAYCFRNVWNEIAAEYRATVAIYPVQDRSATGHVFVNRRMIPMPSASGSYMVYKTALNSFGGGLPTQNDTWWRADEILRQRETLLYLFPAAGILYPRGKFYIYQMKDTNVVLIAMEAKPYWKLYGTNSGTLIKPFYLSIYRDSNKGHDIDSTTYAIPSNNASATIAAITNQINDLKGNYPHGTMVFVNGFEQDPFKTMNYGAGDYVEVVCDRNILASYTVDISDATTGYYSDKYEGHREIIHTPKALNPDNAIITHNTCSYFVRDKDNNKGLFFHRAYSKCIEQITHNDVSVDKMVVNAFADHLGASSVTIHAKIRIHSKDNTLINESSYLKELYTCSDADIVQHLRGTLSGNLTFWKAKQLEDSGYVALMFNTPNSSSANLFDDYVDSLGYRTVGAILSAQISYHTYRSNPPYMTIPKPFILQHLKSYPLTFLRGRKVRHTDVQSTNTTAGNLVISFTDQVVVDDGDPVVVYQVEDGPSQPYRFEISLGNNVVVVPFTSVKVYEEIELDEPIIGRIGSSDKAYKYRPPQAGSVVLYPHEDGGTEIVFGASFYGKTVYVQNGLFTVAGEIPIQTQVDNDLPIVGVLTGLDHSLSHTIPLLGYNCLDLFLNGRWLIPGVDYTAIPYTSTDGDVALIEVVVSNKMFLTTDGSANYLEYVVHPTVSFSEEVGYVVDNQCSFDNVVNVWYPEISRGSISGDMQTGLIDHGTWIEPPTPKQNSEAYRFYSGIPETMQTVLDGYDPLPDTNRIEAMNQWFGRHPPTPPDVVVVDVPYSIYSPWLSAIIHDSINGDFTPVDEPIDETFLEQFAPYDYLKARDPAMVRGPRVDLRYVDISAHYRSVVVGNPTLHRILQRLINLTLPQDGVQSGDTLI